MNCEQAIALISARIDGELSPADGAALETHLGECPACSATAEAFELQDADMRHAFGERRHQAGAVAERVAESLPRRTSPAGRWKRIRRRVRPYLFGAALAAALAGLALLLGVHSHAPNSVTPPAPGTEPFAGLTARAKAAVPEPQKLAVGDTVTTKPGERRRVALPDGSVVYVNQGTKVALDRERHLALSSGEVFVEVTPVRDGVGPFVVQTPQREVTAVGTKFAVQAADKTSVLVTQGYVLASGHDGLIPAGHELSADGTVEDAPRASCRLDWTRDLMAEADTPLVPGSEYGGGALVAVDPYGQQAKLSLRNYHVDVHAEDGFARTTIDQTYFNHANSRLEGTFYFPLPPDASLSRLAMYVDGKRMEGGMVERDFGRQVYEKIVATQRDPALLEWVDGSTFKMRVFPLEARKEKRIILSYTQRLPADYGRLSYRFPAGHSLEVVRDWSFHAVVKGGASLDAESPSHPEMKVGRVGTDLVLDAADHNIAVNRDVVLHLTDPTPAATDVARFSTAEADGYRYLMVRYRPHLDAPPDTHVSQRDWVFLFESSGDRDPLLARTQIEVIRGLLSNAEHSDTFTILSAGTNVRAFAPEAKPVTPENVADALDFLDKSHLIGALDLGKALAAAEPFLKAAKNPYLVHVGTGVAAMGEKRDDVLAKRIPTGTRYVGVGVGRRWNRAFMKVAAERSGGYFTQINPDEPVSWRAFELHAALTAPRLLDVTVTDDAGRRLLTCANSISAGEEVCAALRWDGDDARPPQSVTVAGSLDGAPFQRVLPVRNVTGSAGYIPRTWAKLEIDRLLAEDAVKYRPQVVELSKAMYVMSPFTSLLVLENEQMYRENKVDRGRKDHWAMYPCPDKIKVVYEPDENSPRDPNQAADQKPTEQQVLQTIQVRIPPRCLNWPNAANGPGGPVVTALQLYGSAFAVPDTRLGRLELYGDLGDKDGDDLGIDALKLAAPALEFPSLATRELEGMLPEPAPLAIDGTPVPEPLARVERYKRHNRPYHYTAGRAVRGDKLAAGTDLPDLLGDASVRQLSSALDHAWFEGREGERAGLAEGQVFALGNDITRRNAVLRQVDGGQPLGYLGLSTIEDYYGITDKKKKIKAFESNGKRLGEFGSVNGLWVMATVTETDPRQPPRPRFVRLADGIDRLLSGGGQPRLYARPSFSGDERVFTDLASYAPGMNTSRADIRAVLEAEAAPRLADLSGSIDPAARKLIDRARSAGWQKLTINGKDGKPALTITFDGTGRYAYQHTLASGLREQVVCDGRTLLHLYPDLGIGARRTVSRFHRADFAAVMPWLVLPAEDLAHGNDLTTTDAHTVAISPRDAANAKDNGGKLVAYVRLLMIFGDDGRLTERRLVLMPKDETLVRETYAADGTVQRLAGKDNKELASTRNELTVAAAPDLAPDTAALVVLPLPLRTRDVIYQKLDMNPNQPLFAGENACHPYLNKEAALELFAAEYAAQNGPNARIVYESCFADDTARVPGFHVLLAACGDATPRSPQLQALRSDAKHQRDPLLLYLTFLNLPEYRTEQQYIGLDLAGGLCADHPFLGPLATFRDQWLVCRGWGNNVNAEKDDTGWVRERQRRGLAFVKARKGTALSWALLGVLDNHTSRLDKRFSRELADAWGLFADHPALGYPAHYERARALLVAGQRDEARAQFREMFARAIKAGVLPAVDDSFREALQGEQKEADLWTEEMRQTAAKFCEDHRRPAAVSLAWQCWQLGDRPLASNLLAAALSDIGDEDERVLTTLAAVGFLYQTAQYADADAHLRPLLDDKDLSVQPALWRMAGRIADSRGQTARSIECLERALGLEYRDLPDVINLEEVRRDYGRLLEHYRSLAAAVTAMKIAPPRDLKARTVRAADCWRALDRDEAGRPCDEAAAILRLLGDNELAWEYQTTPIASKPNESGPWLGLAQSLEREGDFALADRAFTAAFESEPTNPQILWDRAQAMRQNGQYAEAQKVLRQIAEGDWEPRFSWVRSQAKWQMDGK